MRFQTRQERLQSSDFLIMVASVVICNGAEAPSASVL